MAEAGMVVTHRVDPLPTPTKVLSLKLKLCCHVCCFLLLNSDVDLNPLSSFSTATEYIHYM